MATDYRLYLLGDRKFEELVGHVCHKILGAGTLVFATGRDGGRDGRFTGTANEYPSHTSPWSGKFIIQAKWTGKSIATCSDYEFEHHVIKKELGRIRNLQIQGELDNYLLFTNRSASGGSDAKYNKVLSEAAGTNNVAVIGLETIGLFLSRMPHVVKLLGIEVWHGPLRIRPDQIKIIIEEFESAGFSFDVDKKSSPPFDYTELEGNDGKNAINGLTPVYFEFVQQNLELHFDKIQTFLQNPINEKLAKKYLNIVKDFQQRIIVEREYYDTFDDVLVAIYDEILDQIPQLEDLSSLVLVFIHYMYANCDLGRKKK